MAVFDLRRAFNRRMGPAGIRRNIRGPANITQADATEAPETITNLEAWWDPRQGLTVNGSNRVSAWVDRVNAHTVTQGTSGSQLLYQATGLLGGPALYGDGARYLEGAASLATSLVGVDCTVVGVMKVDSAGAYAAYGFGLTSSTNYRLWPRTTAGGSLQCLVFDGLGGSIFDLSAGTTTWTTAGTFAQIFRQAATDTADYYAKNSALETGSAVTTWPTDMNTMMIGANPLGTSASTPILGHVADILVYSRVLTTGELSTLSTYFQSRYPTLVG